MNNYSRFLTQATGYAVVLFLEISTKLSGCYLGVGGTGKSRFGFEHVYKTFKIKYLVGH